MEWGPLECMGKTWSVYVSDDELNERIEKALNTDEYHNQAHLFAKAVKKELDDEELDVIT